jgi:hypothetical protein
VWLEEGREPPPVRLTRAGETFYVRDGRHRITAARVAGHVLIEADVRDSWKTTAGAAAAAPARQTAPIMQQGTHGPLSGARHVHLASAW